MNHTTNHRLAACHLIAAAALLCAALAFGASPMAYADDIALAANNETPAAVDLSTDTPATGDDIDTTADTGDAAEAQPAYNDTTQTLEESNAASDESAPEAATEDAETPAQGAETSEPPAESQADADDSTAATPSIADKQAASTAGTVAQSAGAMATEQPNPTKWTRLSGPTDLDTMAKIVQTGFQKSEYVVIASNGGFQDALSAIPLAGKHNAPILLTAPKELSDQTKEEISRLGATYAYLIGGRKALATSVEVALKQLGLTVKRLAGETADLTAVAVAKELGEDASTTCIVATSAGFQDTMSIAPYAYANKAAIFLTPAKAKLSAEAISAIKSGSYEHAAIVGGNAVVISDVDDQLKKAGLTTERIAGKTAYDTSNAVAQWAVGKGMSRNKMGVATGRGYTDALAGAALCGKNNAVLLLVDDTNRTATDKQYRNRISQVERGYVFGGKSVVSVVTWEYLHRPIGATTIIESKKTLANGLYYVLFAKNTGFRVVVANGATANGANAALASAAAKSFQKWQILWRGEGYTIRNLNSRGTLGVSGNSLAGGANVVQQTYNSSNVSQLWAIAKNTDGTYVVRNLKSGMALEVVGAKAAAGVNVRQALPTGGAAQKYKFGKANPIDNGIFVIRSSLGSFNLDVAGGSQANNANVQIYTANKSGAQTFRITREGNYYRITNYVSGKSLGVAGSSKSNGANVRMNPKGGSDAQLWEAVVTDDCYITFVNKTTGKALEVAGGKKVKGTNAQQYASNNTYAQKWRVIDHPLWEKSISGDASLDNSLRDIIIKQGYDLRKCYNYVVKFPYRTSSHASGNNWTIPFAKDMVAQHSGNCYRFAALFMWLARGLGYDAKAVRGYVPAVSGGLAPHGWVEIKYNGKTLVFDPDLQHEIPSRNWYWQTYASAPVAYTKA